MRGQPPCEGHVAAVAVAVRGCGELRGCAALVLRARRGGVSARGVWELHHVSMERKKRGNGVWGAGMRPPVRASRSVHGHTEGRNHLRTWAWASSRGLCELLSFPQQPLSRHGRYPRSGARHRRSGRPRRSQPAAVARGNAAASPDSARVACQGRDPLHRVSITPRNLPKPRER